MACRSSRHKRISVTKPSALPPPGLAASPPCDVCSSNDKMISLCKDCENSAHQKPRHVPRGHDIARPRSVRKLIKTELNGSSCSFFLSSNPSTCSSNDFCRCPVSHKRPRTSWGKPHASYLSLVNVVKAESVDPFDESQVLHEVSAFSHRWGLAMGAMDKETLHVVPSFPSTDHFSLTTSPSEPSSCGQLAPQSSTEAIAGCSPLSCSGEDFSSDDVMSFVVSDDWCDVDSVLDHRLSDYIPRDMRSMLGESADAHCISLAGNEVPRDEGQECISTDPSCTEMSGEVSEEEYRIDLSDFEPEERSETDTTKVEAVPMQGVLCLRLNYEDVLSAWSDRGSFWIEGKRPEVVPDDCQLEQAKRAAMVWEEGLAMAGEEEEEEDIRSVAAAGSCGRNARVMRYREKRRSRLFSKKIRYEVRKLNAERRPRLKGRFIKRTLTST